MNPNSEAYAQGNSYQSGIYLQLIQRVVPRLKRGDWILDIGCGDGKSTSILRSVAGPIIGSGGGILGIDILPCMVQHANTRYGCECIPSADPNPVPTLRFGTISISGPLEEIRKKLKIIFPQRFANWNGHSESDLGFDAIVSSCCLHWVTDLPRAFANMRALLKPAGSLHVILGHRSVGALDYGAVQILKDPSFADKLDKLRGWHDNKILPWRRCWMKIASNEVLDTHLGDKGKDSEFGITNLREIMVNAGWKSSEELNIEDLDQLEVTNQRSEQNLSTFVSSCFPDVLSHFTFAQQTQFFQHFIRFMMKYNAHYNGDALLMSIPLCLIQFIPH